MTNLTPIDWRTIIRRIQSGKFTPFISDRVSSQFLPGNSKLIRAWAKDINYPLGSSFNVTRLAQYLSVRTRESLAAKEEFLAFSKSHLLQTLAAQEDDKTRIANGFSRARLAEVVSQQPMSSQSINSLNPLSLLAKLPLPIYVTTSYYNFLELALQNAGKQPKVEICYWRDELKPTRELRTNINPLTRVRELLTNHFDEQELSTLAYDLSIEYEDLPGVGRIGKAQGLIAYLDRHGQLPKLLTIGRTLRPKLAWDKAFGHSQVPVDKSAVYEQLPSVFDLEPNYQPSIQEPLVFHLHGLDICPASLVLTEDDYLDFLVKVSSESQMIPYRLQEAFNSTSLLLLGYQLQDWDFRVLFRGLITPKAAPRRRLSLSIQLEPNQESDEELMRAEDARDYLKTYFDLANFKIYWGNSQSFMQALWQRWER